MEEEKKKKIQKIIFIIVAIIAFTIAIIVMTLKVYTGILNKAFKNITFTTESGTNTLGTGKPSDISISKQENEPKTTTINFNDTISKESKYEMTVIDYNIAKRILPPKTSGYYSYYEAKEDGHQYLDIKLNYKNLDSVDIDADDVGSIKIKFANKYEYTSFSIIEEADGDFTYSGITPIAPLTTGKLHYLFDIPDEVANSEESIVAYITIGKEKYELAIR